MSTHHTEPIPASQVVAALAIGTIAVLMVGIQPIVLGELVDAHQVSLEGVGIVAMAEIILLGLGVVLGDALLPVGQLRFITIAAALAAAGLDGLTLQATGDGAMTAVRAAAGLAEGVLVWGTTGVIVRTANPARVGGIFFVLQTLAQALVGLLLANAIIPRWGWQGGFMVLGVLALSCCLLAFAQPARLAALAPAAVSGFRWSARTVQPLAVAFLQLATQVVAGSVATFAVRRLPVVPTLAACSLVLTVVTATVYELPGGSTRDFALACLVFGFVWLFMLPFQIGLAFRADASGRLAGLVPAAQLLGSAFGPLMASFIVEGENASAVPLLSAGFAIAACLLVLLGRAPRGAPAARPVP